MLFAMFEGELPLVRMFQLSFCPPHTFYTGTVYTSGVGFALFAFSFLLLLSISHAITIAFPQIASPLQIASKPNVTAGQMLQVFAMAVGAGAFGLVLSLSGFCLTRTQVFTRDWAWSSLRAYAWHDVAAVTTSCRRGSRGSWPSSYVLTMRDGYLLDVLDRGFLDSYSSFSKALRGVDFEFDPSNVAANCENEAANVLRRRPGR
jgi:hypothetical protein